MNILILNTDSSNDNKINGVYTLSIRLVKEFSLSGNAVFYLSSQDTGEFFLNSINQYATIINLNFTRRKFFKEISPVPSIGIDVIFSLTVTDHILSFLLKKTYFKNAKIVSGIYHPFQYFYKKFFFFNFNFNVANLIFKTSPRKNLIFMSNLVKKKHEEIFKLDMSVSPVIPLPCRIEPEFKKRDIKKGRIISIGRLVDFKRYPFLVIDVLSHLKEECPLYEYHIYGDGPLFGDLKKYALDSGVSDRIFFHGNLPYKDIPFVLSDAHIFIGHGTSIVEASGLGVFSLCMAAMVREGFTYGPFYKLPYAEVGDYSNDLPRCSLVDELRRCYFMSEEGYTNESLLCYDHSKSFLLENVARMYLEVFNQADSTTVLNFSARQYQFFRYASAFLAKIGLGVQK